MASETIQPLSNSSLVTTFTIEKTPCRKWTEITLLVLSILMVVGGALSLVSQANPYSLGSLNAMSQLGPGGAGALVGCGAFILLIDAALISYEKWYSFLSEEGRFKRKASKLTETVAKQNFPANSTQQSTHEGELDKLFYESLSSNSFTLISLCKEHGLTNKLVEWVTTPAPEKYSHWSPIDRFKIDTDAGEGLLKEIKRVEILAGNLNKTHFYEVLLGVAKKIREYARVHPEFLKTVLLLNRENFVDSQEWKILIESGLFVIDLLEPEDYSYFIQALIQSFITTESRTKARAEPGAGYCIAWMTHCLFLRWLTIEENKKPELFLKACSYLNKSSDYIYPEVATYLENYFQKTKDFSDHDADRFFACFKDFSKLDKIKQKIKDPELLAKLS